MRREIFQMISQVDDDNSGEIEFAEFLKVIENQKASAAKASDETDTVEAFVALGGNSDKTGEISTEKLSARRQGVRALMFLRISGISTRVVELLFFRNVLFELLCLQSFLHFNMYFPGLINSSSSQDFGLTIDIEKLIKETDTDGSGKVDYAEFKAMMA